MLRTIPAGSTADAINDSWKASFGAGSAESAARTGVLPLRIPSDQPSGADAVICDCLQVRLETIQECMLRGCATQEDLARETGVTTICGGCAPRVAAIVGGDAGQQMKISETLDVAPGIRSIRLTPFGSGDLIMPAIPGQHVVVSALIKGQWVSRPYTLTSRPHELRYYEITVKREPKGLLSSWLFDQRPGDFHPIRVTPPQGRFGFDLANSEPVVFLAGGIGITPAIALLRTLAERNSSRLVHVDYSARDPQSFAFRQELEMVDRARIGITATLRATARGERLTAQDIREYKWRFPRGRFFICGPERYLAAVRSFLYAAGIDESRIEFEVFASARRPAQKPISPGHWANGVSRVIGILLLLLYLGQGIYAWHWPWLEALQEVESYRRWSGAVLLAFVAHQWVLPILRLRAHFSAAVAAVGYRWHRWIGALAPLFFYAHAAWLGYGYLLVLASVYLANIALGLLDKTIVKDLEARDRYARVWLVPHVTLACVTAALAIFHVVVVLAYQ